MPILNINNKNLFVDNPSQKGFMKTKYSSELSKKSNNTEDYNIFIKSQGRNHNISYFRDILTHYKHGKSECFKIKNQQFDENEKSEKIIKTYTSSQFKTLDRTKDKNIINIINENNKEQKFSQTMENYYSRLSNLKNMDSNNSKSADKLRSEIHQKKDKTKIILEEKISALFGIDLNKEKSKKEDLKLFKNVQPNQEKQMLPKLLSFYNINSYSKDVTFRRKTTNELMNFFNKNFTKEG